MGVFMEYKVELEKFEGPLDLLLHLIKKDDIDIRDISIEKITGQYLEYIESMDTINLNNSSEYLTMAAELIEMKSSILLPQKPSEIEEEIDPRQELINKLLDYQQYKEITSYFKELEDSRKEIFTKEPSNLKDYDVYADNKIDESIKIEDLIEAFNLFLKKKKEQEPINTKITTKEYSVSKRNEEIREILKKHKKIEFTSLFQEFNKNYIVVTFLSILDLAKKQEINIIQEQNLKEILIESRM